MGEGIKKIKVSTRVDISYKAKTPTSHLYFIGESKGRCVHPAIWNSLVALLRTTGVAALCRLVLTLRDAIKEYGSLRIPWRSSG